MRRFVGFKVGETCKRTNRVVGKRTRIASLRNGVTLGANRKYSVITGCGAADKSERRARSRKNGLTCVYKYTGNLASFLIKPAMVIYSSVIFATCGNRYVLNVNVFDRAESARAKEVAAGNLCICKRNIFQYAVFSHATDKCLAVIAGSGQSVDGIPATVEYTFEPI